MDFASALFNPDIVPLDVLKFEDQDFNLSGTAVLVFQLLKTSVNYGLLPRQFCYYSIKCLSTWSRQMGLSASLGHALVLNRLMHESLCYDGWRISWLMAVLGEHGCLLNSSPQRLLSLWCQKLWSSKILPVVADRLMAVYDILLRDCHHPAEP